MMRTLNIWWGGDLVGQLTQNQHGELGFAYGTRPTFDGVDQRIETHILDFKGDIYGCEIEVKLLAFIRPELRFESVEALVHAVQGDIDEARVINARAQ